MVELHSLWITQIWWRTCHRLSSSKMSLLMLLKPQSRSLRRRWDEIIVTFQWSKGKEFCHYIVLPAQTFFFNRITDFYLFAISSSDSPIFSCVAQLHTESCQLECVESSTWVSAEPEGPTSWCCVQDWMFNCHNLFPLLRASKVRPLHCSGGNWCL